MSKANNLQPFRPPQFTPVVHPQKPQFIQSVEFPLTGQGMLGANTGVSKQMPHFPQSGEHLPCSGQAQPASQVVPMPYQPARPKSSAPLLSQQQPVFPGGYLPTRGVHIPSLSYICQPYSVPPPGVQARDTALDRSLPLVKSQMQHGHQPVSSSATLPSFGNAKVNSSEPSSSDWQDHTSTDGMKYYLNKKTRQSTWEKPVELMTPLELTQLAIAKVKSAETSFLDWQENTSTKGKKYYYNKKTRQSSWEKPVELMTPLERAHASTEWIGFSTPEGRKYYFNRVTKESRWTIPDKLKIARELAEKASNQLPDRERRTTVGSPVCADSSYVPLNQSSSIVRIIASSTNNDASNSVYPGASISHNMDKDSSFLESDIQIGAPSTSTVAPVTTNTEVPSVESNSGTSRTNNKNSFLTSTADTQDGASAEDLQGACLTISHVSRLTMVPPFYDLEEKYPVPEHVILWAEEELDEWEVAGHVFMRGGSVLRVSST